MRANSRSLIFHVNTLGYYLLVFFAFWFTHSATAATKWQVLRPGLSYQQKSMSNYNPFSRLHVFKLSLKAYQLQLAFSKDNAGKTRTIKTLALKHNALLAINGGFFSPELTPLGLRMHNGQVVHPLKDISWWGVFYISAKRAHLVSHRQFTPNKHVDFAVQSGPRLLVNGRIPKLKPGVAERTALAYQKNDTLIIAITEHAATTTHALALILRDDYHARYALNLDGGSSSQLYAHIGEFKTAIYGYASVSDFILVTPQKAVH